MMYVFRIQSRIAMTHDTYGTPGKVSSVYHWGICSRSLIEASSGLGIRSRRFRINKY